jgi:hypothetical protein
MNIVRWVLRCAVVSLSFAMAASGVAQETDLFDTGDSPPKTYESDAVEATHDEKSIVVKQQTEVSSDKSDFCKCVGEEDSLAVARIEQALRGPLTADGFEFGETPLQQVVADIQTAYGIPVQLDTPALDEIGLGLDEPVTAKLHNISLQSALRLMLKALQLTYVVQDEVILITTPEEAESALLTCVYDVRGMMRGANSMSMDELIDTIVSCVATNTWAENGGGESEIRPLAGGLLVISQTHGVHEEVRSLLASIRQMRGEPTRGGEAMLEHNDDLGRVVTQSYMFQLRTRLNDETMQNRVRELIIASLPDAKWGARLEDGQAVGITVFGDRIVVRHLPTVQEQVEELLGDAGIARPASSQDLRGRGGTSGGGFDAEPPGKKKLERETGKETEQAARVPAASGPTRRGFFGVPQRN